MIDATRMDELRAEIGPEDLAMILDVYLAEAAEMLANLSDGALSADDRGKALHFLRSGALNLGLRGLARAADGPDVDLNVLSQTFEATRRVVAEKV
ncbi:MAG: hypothetical protein AAGF30_13385 [Pseudomonadota bacterium]